MCGGKLGGWDFAKAMRYMQDKKGRYRRIWARRRPSLDLLRAVHGAAIRQPPAARRCCEPLCYLVDDQR